MCAASVGRKVNGAEGPVCLTVDQNVSPWESSLHPILFSPIEWTEDCVLYSSLISDSFASRLVRRSSRESIVP